MSSQLAGRPVPIRILGEDLVIFRDGESRVGLLHRHCAHRRASLEFGRIEQRGIRCCYHGWHFDVDGTILETPGELPDATIRASICQPAYPIRELKGLIFAYMGPPAEMPGFPYLDSLDLPDHELVPYSIHSPSNWLQETENAMDPFHSVFLHGRVNSLGSSISSSSPSSPITSARPASSTAMRGAAAISSPCASTIISRRISRRTAACSRRCRSRAASGAPA